MPAAARGHAGCAVRAALKRMPWSLVAFDSSAVGTAAAIGSSSARAGASTAATMVASVAAAAAGQPTRDLEGQR